MPFCCVLSNSRKHDIGHLFEMFGCKPGKLGLMMLIMDVFRDNFRLLFSGQYGKLPVIGTIVNKPTSIIPVDLSWKKLTQIF